MFISYSSRITFTEPVLVEKEDDNFIMEASGLLDIPNVNDRSGEIPRNIP
jgi:hypothetical protein